MVVSTAWTEKYRPRTFSDLVGQERAARVLEKDVSNPKGSYIFSGQYGGGKTTSARVFASALLCQNKTEGNNPCGVCDSCSAIMEGLSSLGVTEYNASEKSKVEDARSLISELGVGIPTDHRIIILDECHNLSKQAWDTLLKTIESPPAGVTFILVTTNQDKIPNTIVSRSRVVTFDPISDDDIAARLWHIADAEGAEVTDEGVSRAVLAASGSMRSGIKALEDVIDGNFSGDADAFSQLVDAVVNRDIPGMMSAASAVSDSKIVTEDVALERVFNLLSDAVVSGNFGSWGMGEIMLAMKEVAAGLKGMREGGSRLVTLKSTLVLMTSPVEFNQSAAVSAAVLKTVNSEVQNAVQQALSGVDLSGLVGATTTNTVNHSAQSEKTNTDTSASSDNSKDAGVSSTDTTNTKSDQGASVVSDGDTEDAAEHPADNYMTNEEMVADWLKTVSEEHLSDMSEEEVQEHVGGGTSDPWGSATNSSMNFRTDQDMVGHLGNLRDSAELESGDGAQAVVLCANSAVGVDLENGYYLVGVEHSGDVTDDLIGAANEALQDLSPYDVSFRWE